MSEEKSYCRHCHLLVAPGDPGRVSHSRSTGHKACVMRAVGEELREDVITFLTTHNPGLVDEFARRSEVARSHDAFVLHASTALRRVRLIGKGTDASRKKAVTAFAKRLSKKILKELDHEPYPGMKVPAAANALRAVN